MQNKISTGTPGLDEVLCGGFVENCTVLLRGGPGSGKTTIGVQFLSLGVNIGKTPLFITLGEPVDHIKKMPERLEFRPTIFIFWILVQIQIFFPEPNLTIFLPRPMLSANLQPTRLLRL